MRGRVSRAPIIPGTGKPPAEALARWTGAKRNPSKRPDNPPRATPATPGSGFLMYGSEGYTSVTHKKTTAPPLRAGSPTTVDTMKEQQMEGRTRR